MAVKVRGADGALLDNIEAHFAGLDLPQGSERLRARRVEETLREAARAVGYYDYRATTRWDGNALYIHIEPGEPVRWVWPRLRIKGDGLAATPVAGLTLDHPFTVGEPLNHRIYDDFKSRWLQMSRDQGFLDARYSEARLRIKPRRLQAQAIMTLVTGDPYRVGSVSFAGSSLDSALLKRLSPIVAGEIFRRSRVNQLRRNLERSRYFKLIHIETQVNADHTIDLKVGLQDAARHDLGIGAGFATDTGVRVRLRWELPRINRRGHSLYNRVMLSEPRQELMSTYRIPLREPLYQSFNVSAGWERSVIETTSAQVTRLDARVLDQWWDGWLSSVGVGFLRETSQEGSEVSLLTSYLLPGLTLNFAKRDLQPDPVEGYNIWLTAAASAEPLGVDTAFLRLQGGHKRLIDLGGPHLLIARFELGAIVTDDIFDVPLSQRFFTGGDQTVRGFDLDGISSRNEAGDPIGGRYLNVGSLEYSVKIFPSWRFGVFADAGRAYNVSSEPWHVGSGFGLGWLSPIGQVRVDVAWPIDDEFESGAKLHIFMGPLL